MKDDLLFVAGFLLLLLLASWLAPAHASCKWEWVCDGAGNCAHVPLCDSTMDLPPPQPPALKPLSPPAIQPLKPLRIPPLGTRNCEMVQRTDGYGNWYWDEVCY